MKGSEFIFDYVSLLYYKYHKINPDRGESYIDYPDWIKNEEATINPINKEEQKCFQYAVIVALNHLSKHKKPGFYIKICKNKEFCNVLMPSEYTKILEFNQY